MRSQSADPGAPRGSPEEQSNGRGDRWDERSELTDHDQRSLDAIRRQLDEEFGGEEQGGAHREPKPWELRPVRESRRSRHDRSNRRAWGWVRAAVGGFLVGSAVALCLAVLVTALYLKNADHSGSVPADPKPVRPEVARPEGAASISPRAPAPALTPKARPESRAAAPAAPPAPATQPAPPPALPAAPSSRPAPPDSALGENLPPRPSVRPAPHLPPRPPRSSWEIARKRATQSSRSDESP